MPSTSWTQWCNYCHAWKYAWTNDHRRCWTCDNWTMTCHHGCHGCCDHGTAEALRNAESRNSSLYSENSRLHGEVASKSTEVSEKNNQIAILNTDLTNTRGQLTETKGELTTTRKELKDLGELFGDLKIESGKKDKELEIKSKDIRGLKGELGKSQIEVFSYKIEKKQKRLDEFTQQLGVSRRIPRELRKAYRRWIEASENYNRNDITAAEDDIEVIKDELLEGERRLRMEDVQKLCSKCKKFANLKIEEAKLQEQQWRFQQEEQQQYEARQEAPPHNNNQ